LTILKLANIRPVVYVLEMGRLSKIVTFLKRDIFKQNISENKLQEIPKQLCKGYTE